MNAKVLLVDDEPAVRTCLAAALQRFGHTVAVATCGPEALALLAQQPFDLVITDFRMPGGGGEQVVRAVRSRSESIALLMLTAFPAELPTRLRTGPEAVRVLPKPFMLSQLRREVDEVLRANGALVG